MKLKVIKGHCKECKYEFEGFVYSKTAVHCPICNNLLLLPTGGKAKVVGLDTTEWTEKS